MVVCNEKPIKMDDLGGPPLFLETSTCLAMKGLNFLWHQFRLMVVWQPLCDGLVLCSSLTLHTRKSNESKTHKLCQLKLCQQKIIRKSHGHKIFHIFHMLIQFLHLLWLFLVAGVDFLIPFLVVLDLGRFQVCFWNLRSFSSFGCNFSGKIWAAGRCDSGF